MIVEWRKVPGFETYEVNNLGDVRRAMDTPAYQGITWPGRPVRVIHRKGVTSVRLAKDGKARTCSIGRLVMLAFEGDPPFPDSWVVHKNGNTADNKFANLRWSTEQDGYKGGANASKLTLSDVLEIRELRKQPKPPTLAALAARYGVSLRQVFRIVHNQVWRNECS